MREILFRGKTERGEWVYGFLCPDNLGYICIRDRRNLLFIEVIPETVGQSTGLTDKNGIKIFEGDIMTFPVNGNPRWFVTFREGTFTAAALNGVEKEDWFDVPQIAASWWRDQGNGVPSIIGNISENPELLLE